MANASMLINNKNNYNLLIVLFQGDAIEILCVSFVLPSAECDLKMSTSDKGFLSSMTFAGMMFGSYIWVISRLNKQKIKNISFFKTQRVP
jgi:hypothetical protein